MEINKFKSYKKKDYLIVYPSAGSETALQNGGDIFFSLPSSSNPLNISNAYFYYQCEIKDYDDKTTLENNFFPALFNNFRLRIGTTEIENVLYPEVVSSMLNFTILNQNTKDVYGQMMGWIPDSDNETVKTFDLRKKIYGKNTFDGLFPLNPFFGFLQSYNKFLFNIPLEIILNRNNESSKRIFFGDKASKSSLKLIKLELRIEQITLDDETNLNMLSFLSKNIPIKTKYYNRIIQKINLTDGTNQNFQLSIIKNKPTFVLVIFREDKFEYENNNNLFIQKLVKKEGAVEKEIYKIKSIRVQLNNSYYPLNPLTFDVSKRYQLNPYLEYVKSCELNQTNPQLSFQQWKNNYPIFCIDVKDHEQDIVKNSCMVTLNIEKDENFKCTCYCLILEEKEIEIIVKESKMSYIQ